MSSITESTLRIGSFADGQSAAAELGPTSGRFCTGHEQPGEPANMREGGFADGQALFAAAPPSRGRFSTGQDGLAPEHAGVGQRHPMQGPAYARGR